MATYTVTAAVNIDTLASKTGSDTYNINGGYLTIDQHTRYGTNQNTSASMGNITLSATLGGTVEFNSTKVRMIAYNTGTGNVPSLGSTVSQGGASGILLGVYSALNVAPTTAGSGMPPTGYVLIRQWNSVSYAAGALTLVGGATANATEADRAGWLEIVAVDALNCTVPRLGAFKVRGDWYDFQGATTSGSNATTYQIPSNGAIVYLPGVWVETGTATGVYEFYSCAGSQLAHSYSVATDEIRGKVCWISTTGLIRFGNDTTDSTGGYVPPAGRKLRIPNLFFMCSTAGAPTANVLPNVTLGTRYEFTTSGGGVIDVDKASMNWWCNLVQPFSISITDTGLLTQLLISKCANEIVLNNVGVGQEALNNQTTLSIASCFDGGVITNCVFIRSGVALGNGNYTAILSNLENFVFTNTQILTLGRRTNAGTGASLMTRVNNSRFDNCTFGGGRNAITTCTNLDFNDSIYYDNPAWVSNFTSGPTLAATAWTRVTTTATITSANHGFKVGDTLNVSVTSDALAIVTGAKTVVAVPTVNTFTFACLNGGAASGTISYNFTYAQFAQSTFELSASCLNVKMDGLSFGGLFQVQPVTGVLAIGAAGCKDIILRNLGTAASPLDAGGPFVANASWSRTTTVMTITSVGHGMQIGSIIALHIISDVTPNAVTTSTATVESVTSVPTADTFTITVTNAGATSGTCSYYPTMCGSIAVLAANAAAQNVKIQRCYMPHLRVGIGTADNSSQNVVMESVWGSEWGVFLTPQLNLKARGFQSTPALTAQTSVYGTHFIDYYTTGVPANVAGVSWTRATTTATVTSSNHGLRTGDLINVTVTSSAAAIVLGQKTITAITADAFTFTCLNAGSASGTLTFAVLSGRIAVLMNEPTAETTNQVVLANGAAFTSAGGIYMPVIGHQATFINDVNMRGHSAFPIAEAVMAGGTIGNYDIAYSLDDGVTYHNLYYPRASGGGASASTNVTMTSTTGVAVGDYVWGTNIAPNAKVVSITNGTTVVVDIANIGTVSGVLRFNHLPSETVTDALTGFPLRIRITTSTTNATAITSLYFFTNSTTAARAAVYPLDLVNISVIARDAADSSLIENARVYLVAAAGGDLPDGTVIVNELTNISGVVNSQFEYTNPQPVVGRVRKSTSSPLYKTSPLSGTITDEGLELTSFLVKDE